jgi:alkanesulfonate monooxygenase SsuD/methylene tetrahydromethanopterin reductase-like flavin-dependent oxidoreductase (luciferase family)
MGLEPRSPLSAVRECVTTVRRLLAGEEVSQQGQLFRLDRVRLVHPLPGPLPIYTGAMGPKMLQLCGEIADGNIIGVTATPDIVRWSCEQIAAGARRAGRPLAHACPVFVLYAVAHDRAVARKAVRGTLAFLMSVFPRNAYTEHYGCADELERIVARGGPAAVAQEMPEAWLDDFAVAGAPDECAERFGCYLSAGATSVVIAPQPADQYVATLELTAREVFPRLRQSIRKGAVRT